MDPATLNPIVEAVSGNFVHFFTSLLAAIGMFRVIFKPLCELIHAIVKVTPTDKDDKAVASIETNKIFLGFLWVLDYLTSIKIKPVVK